MPSVPSKIISLKTPLKYSLNSKVMSYVTSRLPLSIILESTCQLDIVRLSSALTSITNVENTNNINKNNRYDFK